ncbi:MAG: hypothetical protein JXA07_04080 [Spirochaetes bacterium]|nr:hypothetical protein [Spirochaetota bacterium]
MEPNDGFDLMADYSERLMLVFERFVAKAVPVVFLLIIGIMIGYGWRMLQGL